VAGYLFLCVNNDIFLVAVVMAVAVLSAQFAVVIWSLGHFKIRR
jgi:hypothetical protein